MAASRFKKDQTVFYASSDFALIGDEYVGVVIERVVESCGAKRVTFYDRGGNDNVFGKAFRADSPKLCATAEEAFQHLRCASRATLVCQDVYSDADSRSFRDLRAGTLRLTRKGVSA